MKEGSLVSGKFRVRRLLGRGGTGSVWLADDITSGEKVALKVINEEYRGKGIDNLLRFKKEADVLQGLDHPKIAKLREFDFHDKHFFIAMDYVEGIDLDRFCAARKPMAVSDFLPIAKDLCRTLAFIHSNHVVHGDLKPSNIIVGESGGALSATLLDFGVSSLLLTDRRAVERSLGSYAFMSPEQFGSLKRGTDSRSDLYSLGIVFYYMLAGQTPYSASSVYSLMHQHIAALPDPIAKRNPAVPSLLDRAALKLMSKDAQERYQSAASLLLDLEELERRLSLGEPDPDFPLDAAPGDGKGRAGAASRGTGGFIGREGEMALLLERFERAHSGSGSVLVLTGPAGSGKTRLAEAFKRAVLRSGGIAVAEENHEYGKTVPYGAIMSCVNRLCEMASFFSREKREGLLRDLRSIMGDLSSLVVDYLPALERALPPARRVERLKGEDERKRFEDLVMRLMDRLAREAGAAVFFIDDLQWADKSTAAFIARLAASRADRHYLLLCALRDSETAERPPGAEAAPSIPGAQRLELGPLTFEDTRAMVAECPEIGEEHIWPVTEKIYRRTGGNPLFIVELLRLLREKGLLGTIGDSDYPALQDLPYSDSVASIIRETLGKHPAPFRRIVGRLAVLGKDFSLSDAFRCFEAIPQQELLDAIALARREGVIAVSGDQASFEHDIIHRHFYLALDEGERMEAHESVAAFFESRPGDGESAYRAAQHFARSRNAEKAIHGLAEAGAIALAKHSFADSIAFFIEAKERLEALPAARADAARLAAILIGLGEAYSNSGFHAKARESLEAAAALSGNPADKARAEVLLGSVLIDAGEYEAAAKSLDRALSLLGERAAGKPGLAKELLRYFHRPPWTRAASALERAGVDPAFALKMDAYEKLGLICFWRGKTIPVMASHFKSLNSIDRLGPAPSALRILCVHSALLISMPWPRRLFPRIKRRILKLIEAGRLLKEALPDRCSAAYLHDAVHAAVIFFLEGRLAEARDVIERTMEGYWGEKTTAFLQEITSIYSQILEAYGDIQGLGRLAKRTEEIGLLYSNPIFLAYSRCYRGMYLHMSGNDGEAEPLLSSAIEEFVRHDDKVFQVIAGKYRVRTLFKLGRRQEAREGYAAIVALLKRNRLVHPAFSAVHSYPIEDEFLSILSAPPDASGSAERRRPDALAREALKRFAADRARYPFLEPAGLRLDMAGHAIAGRASERDEAFRAALALSSGRGSTLDKGLAQYQYALCLATDNPPRAEEELGRALLAFDKCGAWREKSQTRDRLRGASPDEGEAGGSLPGPSLKTYQELDAVLSIGKKIGFIHDLDELLAEILAQSIELVGAEQGELFLYSGGAPVSRIRRGMPGRERVATCSGVVSRVDFSGEPELVQNAMTDPHLMNDPDVIEYGLKSIVCVPILSRDEKIGLLYLSNRQVAGLFAEHELDVLVALAGEAAVAIENTILLRRTKELQTRLESIIDSMPTGIVALDQDGRIVQLNRAAARVFPALERFQGSGPFWDAAPELERYREAFARASRKGESREFPSEDFGQRSVEVTVFPLRGGIAAGAALKLSDVTAQKRTQEELIRAQKMEAVGTLVSGIAHDFNNILGGIKATAQYLLQFVVRAPGGPDAAELEGHLKTIDASVGSATELVNQLLTVSVKREAARTRVDMADSVRRVLKVCRASFDRRLQMECGLPEGEAYVLADPVQIEQILLNLFINASHAMTIMRSADEAWGGTLAIRLARVGQDDAVLDSLRRSGLDSGAYWRLSVSDTGIGMKSDIREKIFEPFFTTKKSGKGTGLGLSMTYGIVQALKGRIDVASEPGKGSTFEIYLPVSLDGDAPVAVQPVSVEAADADDAAPSGGAAAAAASAGGSPRAGRVLIIDDDRMLRTAIAKSLELSGWDVLQAGDGVEGELIYERERDGVDFVILDVAMPRQDGEATFRRIKEISPAAKVILTSGFAADERVSRLMREGADCFLAKPYAREELAEAMRRVGLDR